MKILEARTERGPTDTVKVFIRAQDRMRRPVKVTIKVEPDENVSRPEERCAWIGSVSDVQGLFGGLAAFAWNSLNWRPATLTAAIGAKIRETKAPFHSD